MIVVSNSTPLIALAKGGTFSLLSSLFDKIIIPQKVYQEVVVQGVGKAGANEVEEAYQKGWLFVQGVFDQKAAVSLAGERIKIAEAEAIVLTSQIRAGLLIMDDTRAREEAKNYLQNTKTKLIHSGTVLIFAKEAELIPKVKPVLDRMRHNGIWIKPEDYWRILAAAGEL